MASLVKQGHVLAVDAKPAALREIAGPWELPQPNPRTYDSSVYVERYMIDALRRRYRPLAGLPDTAFRVVYSSHLRTMPEPGRPRRTPSDIMMIEEVLPGFIQHIGGMFTTSLLDAVDVANAVYRTLGLPLVDMESALRKLGQEDFPYASRKGIEIDMQYA